MAEIRRSVFSRVNEQCRLDCRHPHTLPNSSSCLEEIQIKKKHYYKEKRDTFIQHGILNQAERMGLIPVLQKCAYACMQKDKEGKYFITTVSNCQTFIHHNILCDAISISSLSRLLTCFFILCMKVVETANNKRFVYHGVHFNFIVTVASENTNRKKERKFYRLKKRTNFNGEAVLFCIFMSVCFIMCMCW